MKNLKRILSMALAMLLALSCVPAVAFAETETELPELPTLTMTEIQNDDVDFALNFELAELTFDQSFNYNNWLADYYVTFNKAVTLDGTGAGDILLSSRNESLGITDWTGAPFTPVSVNAGESFRLMKYVFELDSTEEYTTTLFDAVVAFPNFDLGVKITPEFLEANPNLIINIQMRMTNPEDDTESYVLAEYEYGTPALPVATVTPISKEDLTFALNFVANEPDASQLAYYGNWYADFELIINKDVTFDANGTGDGYLAGQYDAWSPNWIYVPLSPVEIKANEPLRVMEFAAELMSQSGLKMTYQEVLENIKDFDCGVYFAPEFLEANPDLEVSLALMLYDPENETESYSVGDTYVFEVPTELPTVTTTEIYRDDLTFAMNFKADPVNSASLSYYGSWYADFEMTINKDVTFYSDGTEDGYLAGQYNGSWEDEDFVWNGQWVYVPFNEAVSVEAGETIRIMAFAAELMGEPGLKYTYKEVYEIVKDFNCGVFFDEEFLVANPDLEVKLELRMYNPNDETESYVIGETYVFNFAESVAQNTTTGKIYSTIVDAGMEAKSGETIILLKDHTEENVMVPVSVDFDLNGYILTADYVSSFGNIIDGSEDNAGVIVVSDSKFLIQTNNKQLTIKTDKGYQFVEVLGFNTAWLNETTFVFQPLFEADAHELLANGVAVTGVSIQVEVTWKPSEGSEDLDSRTFKYGDNFVTQYINSYKEATGKYGKMFTLTLVNPENYVDLACTVKVVSNTGVAYSA